MKLLVVAHVDIQKRQLDCFVVRVTHQNRQAKKLVIRFHTNLYHFLEINSKTRPSF